MTTIGYHCSHELFRPSELLQAARLAEEAGFAAAMCSDHFHPWGPDGQSGFTWSWLGAAMQATRFSFGMVCAPGQRYHPAIIAQAAATLAEMYPDRLWCAFGSGQNLNEHITGTGWPPKQERMARLEEAVEVIRSLWAGETVTHYGRVVVEEARLYTRPDRPPLIFGAALSNETGAWVARWADGVITAARAPEEQKKFIEMFHKAGGEGKPMAVQALIAYDPDIDKARREAWERWRFNSFGARIQAELKMPEDFAAVAQSVRPADMDKVVRISDSIEQHIEWLQQDIDLGFDRIYIHSAMADAAGFVETFGRKVLPALRGVDRPARRTTRTGSAD